MSGRLGRLGAAFVAPADAAAPPRAAVRGAAVVVPPAVAVLCGPRDARVAGGAAALALAPRGAALLCVWGAASTAVREPARPAARRLAGALAARGHAAHASGRLAVVTLPSAPNDAAAEAARAAAVARGAPSVLALAGPRDDQVDALLCAHDRVLVVAAAEDGSALADLVVAELAASVPVRPWTLAPTGPARTLAASGVGVAASLRPALGAALEGLR